MITLDTSQNIWLLHPWSPWLWRNAYTPQLLLHLWLSSRALSELWDGPSCQRMAGSEKSVPPQSYSCRVVCWLNHCTRKWTLVSQWADPWKSRRSWQLRLWGCRELIWDWVQYSRLGWVNRTWDRLCWWEEWA